jgi:hypothetical protein
MKHKHQYTTLIDIADKAMICTIRVCDTCNKKVVEKHISPEYATLFDYFMYYCIYR